MNNKIKIVATAAVAAMMLTGCGREESLMGEVPRPPMDAAIPTMSAPDEPLTGLPQPQTSPVEDYEEDSDGFVNVDPLSPETTEEATE